ncbi:MAG: biotin attachment protein [Alphaproteobacteria bacterium]|nr:biotin attachment protein [Alphaproteobacteria bacterium]
MIYEVTIEGVTRQVRVERADDGYLVQLDDGPERHVGVRNLPDAMALLVDGRSFDARLVRRSEGWDVDLRGTMHSVEVVDPRRKALRLASGAKEGTLSTSMPGRVVSLLVAPGDVVEKGQPLLVIEAMKMENELKASISGEVAEILVAPGQALEAGAKLLRINPTE